MKRTITSILVLGLFGCVGAPQGIEPVSNFDLERYLGTWYEIARLDHRFERGLNNVTATYSLRDDGGVSVVNRGYDAEDNAWRQVTGRAYFTGPEDVGQLKVTFFWPFYGGYTVFELDHEHYRYAMVCGPSRSYLWILARDRSIPDDLRNRLIEKAARLGFAVDKLITVRHDLL